MTGYDFHPEAADDGAPDIQVATAVAGTRAPTCSTPLPY